MSWMDGIDLITGRSRILTKERTMTDKTGATRKALSPQIIKVIRDAEGKEMFNDDIARKLKLTRAQVRNSVRQLLADHPEYGIVEVSPYYYAYDETLVARPTSGAPRAHPFLEDDGQVVAMRETIRAKDGWASPMVDGVVDDRVNTLMEMPADVRVEYDERFLPLVAGMKMLDAVISHVGWDDEMRSNEIYFVWRGKMWKAFQI